MFSFFANTSIAGCVDAAKSSHCLEKVSDMNFEMSTCHDSTDKDQDDHSSDNCDCQCHGHGCNAVKIKNYHVLRKLESYSKSALFPILSLQKLSDYHSQINRPPIS
jgi:hypothetical protein